MTCLFVSAFNIESNENDDSIWWIVDSGVSDNLVSSENIYHICK